MSPSGAINACSDIACSRFRQNGHVYVAGFLLCARRTVHQRAASLTGAGGRAP